jgi:hypothetical protein
MSEKVKFSRTPEELFHRLHSYYGTLGAIPDEVFTRWWSWANRVRGYYARY